MLLQKKSNELMATSYSHLYKMDTVGLRFFTVYGPWGRPDMALFKFTKNIIKGNLLKYLIKVSTREILLTSMISLMEYIKIMINKKSK